MRIEYGETCQMEGETRYYGVEKPALNPGLTRGASYVTEYDPKNRKCLVPGWKVMIIQEM